MTEIEEKFYKVFGIEPIEKPSFGDIECDECIHEDCDNCGWAIYPKITDRILLELICVLGTIHLNIILKGKTIKEIKEFVLNDCIIYESFIGQQVKALFEKARGNDANFQPKKRMV